MEGIFEDENLEVSVNERRNRAISATSLAVMALCVAALLLAVMLGGEDIAQSVRTQEATQVITTRIAEEWRVQLTANAEEGWCVPMPCEPLTPAPLPWGEGLEGRQP